jgi:hypothetical protein
MRLLRRRRQLGAIAAIGLATGLLGLVMWHGPILRAAAWLLVANDLTSDANVIVGTVDASTAGVLEAADLVRTGRSARVTFVAARPTAAEAELHRCGIPYEDNVARSIRLLRRPGIERGERIPSAVSGTEDDAEVLPGWFDAHGFHSAIVIANADHTRRMRRTFRRSMRDHATVVTIQASRYSEFDPNRWWTTRNGLRIGIGEFHKLLFDVVRHPFD